MPPNAFIKKALGVILNRAGGPELSEVDDGLRN